MAGHEAGQEAVDAVGQQAALDAGVRIRPLDGQAAHVAGGLPRARDATRDPRLQTQAALQRGFFRLPQGRVGAVSVRVGPCACMQAWMSPTVSTAVITKPSSSGMKAGG